MTAGDIWLRMGNYFGHYDSAGVEILSALTGSNYFTDPSLSHNGLHLFTNSGGPNTFKLNPADLSLLATYTDDVDGSDTGHGVAVRGNGNIITTTTDNYLAFAQLDDSGVELAEKFDYGLASGIFSEKPTVVQGSDVLLFSTGGADVFLYDIGADTNTSLTLDTPTGLHGSPYSAEYVVQKQDGGFWILWIQGYPDPNVYVEHDSSGNIIQQVALPNDAGPRYYDGSSAFDVNGNDDLIVWVHRYDDGDSSDHSMLIKIAKTTGVITDLGEVNDIYGFGNSDYFQNALHVERDFSTPTPLPLPEQVQSTGVGELGCGTYRVLITERCGGRVICELTDMMSALTYNRLMDDTSEAQAVINLSGDGGNTSACCACLGDTRTWLHSMLIYRDEEIVWGPGPVYNLLYRKDTVTVTARDVSAWLDVRVVHHEYTKALGTDFVQKPIDYIVRTILTDALSAEDPCNLVSMLDVGSIPALMDKEASIGDGYAGDILRDLARNVLDYTVVGNRIIIREQLSFGPYSHLHDEDFQTEIEVEERGAEAGTKWYVNGSGVYGSCGGEPEHIQYLGLIEQVDSEDQITDLNAVKSAACSRLQGSNPAPLYVNVPDGARLSPSAGVTMNQLIPGTLVDVSLRDICRAVTVRQRLTAVHVTVTDGDEAIGVTLSPLGTGFGEAGGAVSRQPQR